MKKFEANLGRSEQIKMFAFIVTEIEEWQTEEVLNLNLKNIKGDSNDQFSFLIQLKNVLISNYSLFEHEQEKYKRIALWILKEMDKRASIHSVIIPEYHELKAKYSLKNNKFETSKKKKKSTSYNPASNEKKKPKGKSYLLLVKKEELKSFYHDAKELFHSDTTFEAFEDIFSEKPLDEIKPIKWQSQKNLLAYLLDGLRQKKKFPLGTNIWAIGECCFNIKNLCQLKDLYRNNKKGMPNNHQKIDAILSNL